LSEINASNTKRVNIYPTSESMSILNPEPKPQSHKAAKSQCGSDNVNPRMIFFLKAAPLAKKNYTP
jgi:hypothetical protein